MTDSANELEALMQDINIEEEILADDGTMEI